MAYIGHLHILEPFISDVIIKTKTKKISVDLIILQPSTPVNTKLII